MKKQPSVVACLLALTATSLIAQSQPRWVMPRTVWGDPDLTGTWTTTRTTGVPLERPARFGNRRTLTDQEFAQLKADAEKQAQIDDADFDPASVASAPNVAEFIDRLEGRVTAVNFLGPAPLWYESGTPSRQTSLLVDPPDGRFPPLTAGGQRRAQELAARRAKPGPMNDRRLYPRCVSRGLVGSALPMITDSGNDITQAPGYVAIRHEMIHEARVVERFRRSSADTIEYEIR